VLQERLYDILEKFLVSFVNKVVELVTGILIVNFQFFFLGFELGPSGYYKFIQFLIDPRGYKIVFAL
jgi:hypothetical protein